MSELTFAPALPYQWAPQDNALQVANDDPWASQSTFTLIAGTLYLLKVKVPFAITISNLRFMSNGAAGAGASTGSFAGVFTPAGLRQAVSADQGANFTNSFVPITVPLPAPLLISPPFIWVAVLSNLATTQPTFASGSGNGNFTNCNLSAASYRFCVNGTGLTSIPASITPASNSLTGNASIWAGAF